MSITLKSLLSRFCTRKLGMKKPIILSVFFFILTAISSFGQGVWIEETVDPDTGLRTGKIKDLLGVPYDIKPNATLEGADLTFMDLSGVNLSGADLTGVDVTIANLSGANLSGANLSGANLGGANLSGANLSGANLNEANLDAAVFEGANLSGATFEGTKVVIFNDFEKHFFQENRPDVIDVTGRDILSLITAVSRGNYNEVQELKLIVKALGQNDISIGEQIGEQLTTLGQNDISIGEQMDILGAQLAQNDIEISRQIDSLGQNDTAIGEQITKLGQNDESIMAEINAMKAQLQTLVASVAEKDAQIAEKDAKIAELEQGGGGQSLEQVLEQVRDARAGSVVLTVDPEGDTVTLGLTIEQSDNLIEWTKLDGEMTRTIPIPDGKKFYRFALDK